MPKPDMSNLIYERRFVKQRYIISNLLGRLLWEPPILSFRGFLTDWVRFGLDGAISEQRYARSVIRGEKNGRRNDT
jgi:hypothetical protein